MTYRKLAKSEIGALRANGCRAEDWDAIEVKNGFNPKRCINVRFSGKIKLGVFEKETEDLSGVPVRAGIENALLHNCIIEDNVSVFNVSDYMANYLIDEGTVIRNCGKIHTEGISSFGNGVEVAVMVETGGRSIRIWDGLSSHLAYLMALYRHRPVMLRKTEDLIIAYAEQKKSSQGYIGKNSKIINCSHIRNVLTGPFTSIEGALFLNEGSVNSINEAPVYIGPGVIMDHFIVNSGSVVTESAMVERCFIGQGCHLGKQFSAHNSLFFANSRGYHGEVFSVFAGPYTVTHHKSTLLIAGYFSFMNAGSGSNQSNHMYKLGPVHQGVIERGTKTASDSYLLWPARIGPYSLVTGRHYGHTDTSVFPFSYLVENNRETILIPAINLVSTGTIRDSLKWTERDMRKDPEKTDFLIFSHLTPYTAERMVKAREILIRLKKKCLKQKHPEYCLYDNLKIKPSSLERGIKLYGYGIDKYTGDVVLKKLSENNTRTISDLRKLFCNSESTETGEWTDLAGLITPDYQIARLIDHIESDKSITLNHISRELRNMYENFHKCEWEWVTSYLEKDIGKPRNKFSAKDIIRVIKKWKKSNSVFMEKLLEDAKKEFSEISMTGFGIDGDGRVKEADYLQVRGSYDSHPVVKSIRREANEKLSEAEKFINILENTGD